MPRLRILTLLFGDLLVLFVCYLISAKLLIDAGVYPNLDLEFFLLEEMGLLRIAVASFSMLPVMYFLGMYEKIRIVTRYILFEDLLFCFGLAFLIQAMVSYGRSNYVLSRYMMLSGSILSLLMLIVWRSAYSSILLRVVGRQRILFVGDSQMARDLASMITAQPERGYEVAGLIDPSIEGSGPAIPCFSLDQDLDKIIEKLRPDRIAVIGNFQENSLLSSNLLACSMKGLRVESVGDLYEDLHTRVSLESITLNQLIFSPVFRPINWVVNYQEVYCRIIAAVALLFCWPIMLLAALAVRLDSEGPALLRQVRLGKGGVPFFFLKFRSMRVDADKLSGPVRAKENDPRITRVGRWIRLTRIDELPQFINVLRGEMMLVGPRPEMPALEAELLKSIPLYTQRHRIKPGITGWAQIHHTPEDSLDSTRRKLEYDLYYIRKMSPGFDMLILFYTIKAVMLRIGAR